MYNQAPVLENDTHKLQWDFNIQTDPLIPARRPDLIIINNKKKKKQKKKRESAKLLTLLVLSDHRINLKESEKKG